MRKFIFRFVIAVTWFTCSSLAKHAYFQNYLYSSSQHPDLRESVADEFPTHTFTLHELRHGAVLLHITLALYLFVVIAYVCSDYFLPSVECICVDLNLSQDVAGATFMAMATSTPELFVNIIGTFITESDVGVGAVVGSAVFNTLGVAAASGLATLEAIKLDWWPLTRDCLIYVIVLITLSTLIWDHSICWTESLVMIVEFVVYFILMYSNNIMMRGAKYLAGSCYGKGHDLESNPSETDIPGEMYRAHSESVYGARASAMFKTKESIGAEQKLEKMPAPSSPFELPGESWTNRIWWLLVWPILFALFCTVPNCRRNKFFRRLYPLTFLMCVVWIGGISYLLTWMITVIGETFGIPASVSGLTLLAFGGCLPETVASIIMVRHGEGSMGISNSLGANTLDILMCLGFPWFVKSLISGEPVDIVSDSMNVNCLSLLGLVIVYFIIMIIFKFTLNKKLGITYALLYIIYIVIAVLFELDVFSG